VRWDGDSRRPTQNTVQTASRVWALFYLLGTETPPRGPFTSYTAGDAADVTGAADAVDEDGAGVHHICTTSPDTSGHEQSPTVTPIWGLTCGITRMCCVRPVLLGVLSIATEEQNFVGTQQDNLVYASWPGTGDVPVEDGRHRRVPAIPSGSPRSTRLYRGRTLLQVTYLQRQTPHR
jgi:hypothetical protein